MFSKKCCAGGESQQHKYQVSLLLQLLSVFSSLELLIISDKTALLLILNRIIYSVVSRFERGRTLGCFQQTNWVI